MKRMHLFASWAYKQEENLDIYNYWSNFEPTDKHAHHLKHSSQGMTSFMECVRVDVRYISILTDNNFTNEKHFFLNSHFQYIKTYYNDGIVTWYITLYLCHKKSCNRYAYFILWFIKNMQIHTLLLYLCCFLGGGGGDKANFEIHSIIFLATLRKDMSKAFQNWFIFWNRT